MGLPLFPGQLVENEDGPLWAEEKNKAEQGGWEGEGQRGWLEPVFSQHGRRGGLQVPDQEEDGRMEEGDLSFYISGENNGIDKGNGIKVLRKAKRAWNSYFTGGFGKRAFDSELKASEILPRFQPALFVRPLRSLPGAS